MKRKRFSIDLVERIARACEGLFYMSEDRCSGHVYVTGPVDEVNAETMRAIANAPEDARIEEIDFHRLFARLTTSEVWHDVQREQKKISSSLKSCSRKIYMT